MGQEIGATHFEDSDFEAFLSRLTAETELLKQCIAENRFNNTDLRCGFELETWLVDQQFRPAPINEAFIRAMGNPLVTHELANFNLEFNYTPQDLNGSALGATHAEMASMVGCRREMVSRIMSDLSKGGYITLNPDAIVLNRKLPAKW